MKKGKVKLEESTVLQPNSISQVTVSTDTTIAGPVRVVYTLPQL